MTAEKREPFSVTGTLVDPECDRTYGARISVSAEGKIKAVEPIENPDPGYILPGFVDAHMHVESSMLTPPAFAQAAVRRGTLAAAVDPHEIANVLGEAGVRLMIDLAKQTPFVFGFGAPSCVPVTPFEPNGATLSAGDVEKMLAWPEITHLSEMMNVPGVLAQDPEVMAKLAAASRAGKPVDGHAPGLSGKDLQTYIAAGISTDHEMLTFDEALEKINRGMFLQIRHGSAAHLVESLLPLLSRYPKKCMFCSDDKHPDDLLKSHINYLAAMAYRNGISLGTIVQVACVNPVRHYLLPLGLLQPGDPADFQIIDDLSTFTPREVWLHGRCVCRKGESFLPEGKLSSACPNVFAAVPLAADAFRIPAEEGAKAIHVIVVQEGKLATKDVPEPPAVRRGNWVQDPERDLLKIAVVNRYCPSAPTLGFVKGFGLKRGAIATSVSHDAHNVIAVGTSDAALTAAVNHVILMRGGLAVADNNRKVVASLPLPVGGLMSDRCAEVTARGYQDCDMLAKIFGSPLSAPFMTLSFLSLPVIPELRLTARGLFNARTFHQIGLRAE